MIHRSRQLIVVAILIVAALVAGSPRSMAVHADSCFGGGCPQQAQAVLLPLPVPLRLGSAAPLKLRLEGFLYRSEKPSQPSPVATRMPVTSVGRRAGAAIAAGASSSSDPLCNAVSSNQCDAAGTTTRTADLQRDREEHDVYEPTPPPSPDRRRHPCGPW